MTRKHTLLLALGLLPMLTVPASAHEEGTIHLASEEVPAGGSLTLRGEHLPESATLRLELQGALETVALGEVRTDSLGAYQGVVPLPAAGRPGSYAVVAIASDGDVVARADLVIQPAAESPAEQAATTPAEAAPPAVATAAMMDLPTQRSPAEWAGILGLTVLALAGGTALLRSAARG